MTASSTVWTGSDYRTIRPRERLAGEPGACAIPDYREIDRAALLS